VEQVLNPDESRIGHYWLRNPAIVPTAENRKDIEERIRDVKTFASEIISAKVQDCPRPSRQCSVDWHWGSTFAPQFVKVGATKETRI
jgi:hypothetical protein